MIKNGKSAVIALAVVLTGSFSGCAQKHETQYVTLPEIYTTANDVLKEEYQNLYLPETIDITKVSALYTFEGGWGEDVFDEEWCCSSVKDIAKNLYDISLTDEDVKISYETGSAAMEYRDDKYWISMGGIGHLNIFDSTVHKEAHSVNTYSLNLNNNYREKNYTLAGEEVNVGEAEDYCLNLLTQLTFVLNEYEKPELFSITTIKYDDGEEALCFVFNKNVKGLSVSNECTFTMINGLSKPSLIRVIIDGKNHAGSIADFYYNNPKGDSFKEFPSDTKFITLESAAWLLSDYLAPEHPYKIWDIDIKYACITHFPEERGMAIEKTFRPMWVFNMGEKTAEESYVFNGKLYTTGYVDMVTGDVFVVDDIGQNVFFELK